MPQPGNTTRDKIITATIDSIEENGIQDVTVRKIAQKAQVNVAAVNYHFSSKKNLLEEALKTTLDNLFIDWEEILDKNDFDIRECLSFMLHELISGSYQFPNITKAHIYDGFVHYNFENEFFKRFSAFLNLLLSKMEDKNPGKSRPMKMAVIQLFSASILPGLLPGLFGAFPQLDLSDSKNQNEYISFLIDHYISDFLA